jgi:hypothetical protein
LNIFVIHALGDVISPVIIGILGDQRGMNFAFRLVAVMFLVASALWLAGIKFLKRDTEMAPVRFGRQQPPSPSPGGSKAG